MTSTSPELPGYRIIETLGVAQGLVVRLPGFNNTLKASFKAISGGQSEDLRKLCETTRREAFDQVVETAEAMGANAVIAFRYDATTIFDIGSEVICYGTAVVVEKLER